MIVSCDLADTEPVSEFLLIKISEILKKCDLTPADLSLIAVSLGPGSLTGLRIGIAVGQGLANSLGIPCVGFSVFTAMKHSTKNKEAIYVIGAGNKRFYWVQNQNNQQSDIQTGNSDELLADLKQNGTFYITGDAWKNFQSLRNDCAITDNHKIINNIAELTGEVALSNLEAKTTNLLTPVYVGETGFKKLSFPQDE